MPDRFVNTQPSLSGPAASAFAIVPSDSLTLPETTRGLYVGGGGNLSVTMLSGETVLFVNVADSSLLPLRVAKVLAASTTATGIVGLL